MNYLKENIRYLREQKGLSIRKLEITLGVGRGNVYNWETGKAAPPVDEIIKMSRLFNVEIGSFIQKSLAQGFIEHGNSHDKSDKSLIDESPTVTRSSNLFIPIAAQAGYGIEGNTSDEIIPIIVPGVKGEARTFEVQGESMLPLIFPGDYVVCKKIESIQSFTNGQIYVIISKSDGVAVKYLNLIETGILCMSENSKTYKSFIVSFEDVIEVWVVKTLITDKIKRPLTPPGEGSLIRRIEVLEGFLSNFLPEDQR